MYAKAPYTVIQRAMLIVRNWGLVGSVLTFDTSEKLGSVLTFDTIVSSCPAIL